jgi:amino-acid N-acetyltransferase
MPSDITIRKARMVDVPAIHSLILKAAKSSPVLPRSQAALYETLRDFFVSEDEAGSVVGCCALHISWTDLAEIKSLSVDESARHRGLGRTLVQTCLDEARDLRIRRVFALTAAVEFFAKLGFREVDKRELPHKIWGDCINCPKFPDCDEVAMVQDQTWPGAAEAPTK